MLPTVVSRQNGIEQSAERAQLLGRRLRESTGADPTVAFLEKGSASGGSGRTPSNP
jgi:hypothetical protein